MVQAMSSNLRTATFLFTDLENSTPLWESHPDLMPGLSARHDALMQEAIAARGGRVVKSTGDGFHAVFDASTDAVASALAGQLAMHNEPWPAETGPLRVRMGLHTGESREREGDFYGSEVNRAARLMGVAHGGQILVSQATAALIRTALPHDVSLRDLGEHRLRGLAVTERISQLRHPDLPGEFPPLKSLSTYKHNLPVQLSTFVGREKELADVNRLLKGSHLLTLLGPGGTGKTRLMLEAAEEIVGDFANGVFLVELAPLTDPDLIEERVATALGVQEQPGRAMLESLVEFLRLKELLLLLDNVEHVVRRSAEMAEHLLRHCPKLKMLVTGREALFIGGEVTLQIPSLSLPPGNGKVDLDRVRSSEAVQLFLTRAQEFRPAFELSDANASTIAEIVCRLDGIPLALELATARLRMLTVDQIAARLNDRFRLLTGGRRTAMARQQTLQAMIDWSWNLLDDKERLLLQRLSVFSGGWSMAAAQSVVTDHELDEYDVFDLMEQLVVKSLVTVNYPASGSARYSMLESIRQYGRDRLFESGESEALRDRFTDYYVAFAEEAGPHLRQSDMLAWMARIIAELDNLRAVMVWTQEERPELALRIASCLIYGEVQWLHPSEARSWLQPAIQRARVLLEAGSPELRIADFIRALIGLGATYAWYGRPAEALPLLDEGILLARRHGEDRHRVYATAIKYGGEWRVLTEEQMRELEEVIDVGRQKGLQLELMSALGSYGFSLVMKGKMDEAEPYVEETLALARELDNPYMNALVRSGQGFIAHVRGDFAAAKEHALESLVNYEALNMKRSAVTARSMLAHVARREGDLEEAEGYYRKTIIGWQELGHGPAVAHQVECFAYLALERGQHERAARLLGAAGNARRELNSLSDAPREIADLDQAMKRLAEAMGKAERDKSLAKGRQMSLDDAVTLALGREG
jgi:predicted ATPase/class 3 adenylate cyclase